MMNNKPIESFDEEMDLNDLQGIAGGNIDDSVPWPRVRAIHDMNAYNSPYEEMEIVFQIKAGEIFQVYGMPGGFTEVNGMLYTSPIGNRRYCWVYSRDIEILPE